MALFRAADLDRRVRIERPVPDTSHDGAGSGGWDEVGTVWAQVRDSLPSRAEQDGNGMPTGTRRARVRMRWRGDLTASMRFVLGERIMQIVAGPAELGRREGLEFMVEEHSPAGNTA